MTALAEMTVEDLEILADPKAAQRELERREAERAQAEREHAEALTAAAARVEEAAKVYAEARAEVAPLITAVTEAIERAATAREELGRANHAVTRLGGTGRALVGNTSSIWPVEHRFALEAFRRSLFRLRSIV
jgi:chromosome segregation ATPase